MNIEHMALNVPDPLAMAGWYTTHMGMRVVRSLPTPPFTHFLADESGKMVLEIYHHTKAAIPDYFSFDPLVLHVAFTTSTVRETRERLIKAGATPAGEIAVTSAGDEMAFLHDPWGVAIQLVHRAHPLID
jgi:glyoxylase I family protein